MDKPRSIRDHAGPQEAAGFLKRRKIFRLARLHRWGGLIRQLLDAENPNSREFGGEVSR